MQTQKREPKGSLFYSSNNHKLIILVIILASKLACTADGFRCHTNAFLGWFFIVTAFFDLAEDSLALHLLLQSAQSLVHVVITH